jgi:putative PIN family toxin of toxin-antitoxin system
MLKAVADTNVLVSSLLVRAGGPARVLSAWRERQFLLVTSPSIVAAVRAALNYPRIRRKYASLDEDVDGFVLLLFQEPSWNGSPTWFPALLT